MVIVETEDGSVIKTEIEAEVTNADANITGISLSFCFNYKKRQSVTFIFKQLITNGL